MAKIRINLSQPIESRTASFAKDSFCANGYFETRDKVKRDFITRPGLDLVTLSAPLPVTQGQGMYAYNGYLWICINNTVYRVDTYGTVTNFGSFANPGYIANFGIIENNRYLVFHNTINGYYIAPGDTVISQITDANFPNGSLVPGLVYLDGYTFVMTAQARIYNSAINDPTTWGALDYITAEAEPDKGVALAKHFNYIVAFGEWSTEFFYDAANAVDSPLERNDGLRLEIGCANGYTVQQLEQTVIWCGQSKEKGRAVYLMEGTSPVKLSTRYVEKYLNKDAMTSVKSWVFKIEGHTFYVLNMVDSNITLVYDLDEKAWYNWTSQADGVEKYWTPSFFASYNNKYYALDDTSGNLYTINVEGTEDYGNAIYYRSVTDRFDAGNDNAKFHRRLIIIGDRANATLSIRHCNDDYQTYSAWRTVNLASDRPQLNQLGKGKRRSYEFLCTDKVKLRLDAAELSFDIGRLDGGDTPSQQGSR